ncbi:hypothetical protein BC834DRAFT_393598 [Gloeopeniophorella convolvens]|nr:hypothetical protein BC834DRAFT_393598 [Gloeopeniophorella convolvens]
MRRSMRNSPILVLLCEYCIVVGEKVASRNDIPALLEPIDSVPSRDGADGLADDCVRSTARGRAGILARLGCTIAMCPKPRLDRRENELHRVEVGRVGREKDEARAVRLDHLVHPGHLVQRRVVDDEHRVGQRPLVHVLQQRAHEQPEVVVRDGTAQDLGVEDPVERDGREYRVELSAEEDLAAARALALWCPDIRSLHRETAELAFVGEHELVGAEVLADVRLVRVALFLAEVDSRLRDLRPVNGFSESKAAGESARTVFIVYPSLRRVRMTASSETSTWCSWRSCAWSSTSAASGWRSMQSRRNCDGKLASRESTKAFGTHPCLDWSDCACLTRRSQARARAFARGCTVGVSQSFK